MNIRMTSVLRPCQTASNASKPEASQKTRNSEGKSMPRVDTFESSASKVFGGSMLSASDGRPRLESPVLSSRPLEYFDPNERDGIDWETLEKDYFGNQRQVTIDNGDSIRGSVDHMVSMYVAVKSTLEEKYSGQEDVLTEKMNRLNGLLDKAKRQMSSSYERTVGGFYETMGNKGAASAMGSSLSAAIDRRISEMEETAKTMNSFKSGAGADYVHRQLVLEVWGFNQREEGGLPEAASHEEGNLYSLEDLEAAGMAAKAAANMNSSNLHLMSNEELGICLASRYMKMACLLGKTGVSRKMSDMILKSFGTFLNRYSGNALSSSGGAAKAYKYALDQYNSSGDMAKAITESGRKYGGDSFFSDFRNFGGNMSMSLSARYNLDIGQFIRDLESSGPSAVLSSVSGKTGIDWEPRSK